MSIDVFSLALQGQINSQGIVDTLGMATLGYIVSIEETIVDVELPDSGGGVPDETDLHTTKNKKTKQKKVTVSIQIPKEGTFTKTLIINTDIVVNTTDIKFDTNKKEILIEINNLK